MSMYDTYDIYIYIPFEVLSGVAMVLKTEDPFCATFATDSFSLALELTGYMNPS
jgi:hypothetical protein